MKEFLEVEIKSKEGVGLLKGYTVSFKDCITVKGVETRASSKILKGYKPVFNATVVEKVLEEGGEIIGKSKQDAFGFGSFGLNHENPPLNPLDKTRVIGGSSSGAAGLAKTLKKHIAVAESTGGSIANPACFCEVVGLTPTYGLVSRYGLLDYGNSLDKIGVITNNVSDAALGLKVIAGYDEKDSTSKKVSIPDYTSFSKTKFTIGVPKEYLKVDGDVKKFFDEAKKKLKNVTFKEVSLKLNAEYSIPTYYLIACSEASTNLAKYSGLRYGYTEDINNEDYNTFFKRVRTNAFSSEAKRRIILGTFARMEGFKDDFYVKALKVRTLLINEYKKVFEGVDLILHPTMPCIAPKVETVSKLSPLTIYNMDLLTAGANLAGLPHISVPYKQAGLMFIAPHFEEKRLLDMAKQAEDDLR